MIELMVFTKKGCGPCNMLKPTLAKLPIAVKLIDALEDMDFTRAHGVTAAPTLIWLKDGLEVRRDSGALRLQQLLDIINSIE